MIDPFNQCNSQRAGEHPLSPQVLAYFRSTGKGWQTRMDAAFQLLIQKHPDWLKKLR